MKKSMKGALWLLFLAYCSVMGYLLFGRSSGVISEINLVPFKTIGEFWTVMLQSFGVEGAEVLFISSFANLAGNVVLFIPLGIFLPRLWKALERWWSCLAACAVLIIAVELTQYAAGLGSADIDDFILNMLGGAIGFMVFALCRKMLYRDK